MNSTSSTTSPDDASKNSTEATSEDATRPFPASGDTRPLTMPLPTSDGVATDVLSTEGAPSGTDQVARTDDADAKSKAAAPTDVPTSPTASSAQNQNGFSTAFDTDPFGREGKNGKGRVTSADSAPASSTPGPVWSAGTVAGHDQRPQAPQDIKGSTLLWGAFLLLIGGLLIAAGLGLRFDFTTTAIACLAGLGGLLVVAALVPKGRRSIKP